MDKGKLSEWGSANGVDDSVIEAIKHAVLGNRIAEEIVDTVLNENGSMMTMISALKRRDKNGRPVCNSDQIFIAYKNQLQRKQAAPSGGTYHSLMPTKPSEGGAEPAKKEDSSEETTPVRSGGLAAPPPGGVRRVLNPSGGAAGGGEGGGTKMPLPQSRPQGIGPKIPPTGGLRGKKTTKPNMTLLWVGGVVVLLIIALVGYFVVSAKSSPSGYTAGGANSTEGSATPQATPIPEVLDEKGNVVGWYAVPNTKKMDLTESFLVKPESFSSFLEKVPWRWLLWVLFLFPMLSLLASDRFAANERTDIKAVMLSLFILVTSICGAEVISQMFMWILATVGYPMDFPVFFVNLIGIAINLIGQWLATSLGDRDYSAFAIGGLFITGALLIWWYPTLLIVVVIGGLFMAGGMALQAYEMSRTHQTGAAIIVAFSLIGLFILFAGIWLAICLLVSTVQPPNWSPNMVKLAGFFIWGLVSSQYWMAGVIGLGLASAFSGAISTALMPPKRQTSQDADRRSVGSDKRVDSDITARYDAMVFAIMCLYPLAFVAWEVVIRYFAAGF